MRVYLKYLFAAGIALGRPRNLEAQQSTATANSGRIPAYQLRVLGAYDATTGRPVEGVHVTDLATGVSALTTATGTVSLAFLNRGTNLLRLQKVGYRQDVVIVRISPADTIPLTELLQPIVDLPTVTTRAGRVLYRSPALRDFEERRLNAAAGHFVSDSALRQEESRTLGDVLRTHMPNVNLGEGPNGAVYLRRSPRCAGGASPQVYMDGVLLSAAGPSPGFNLAQLSVTDLAGIEWYADNDQVPVQFSHTSASCGTLLLWTRER